MVQDELMEEQSNGLSTGPIIAAAVAAGVAAFLIRRARKEEERHPKTPAAVAAVAWERAQDPEFRRKAAETSRDWMFERILPELKPILLDLLKGLKELTDQGFKGAEKAIKDL
jgi:hypothetical protein